MHYADRLGQGHDNHSLFRSLACSLPPYLRSPLVASHIGITLDMDIEWDIMGQCAVTAGVPNR